jgi:hypothetical protein
MLTSHQLFCWCQQTINFRNSFSRFFFPFDVVIVGRDSSVGIATRWTVRGSNPGGCEIFRTRPHRSWGSPSLLYNGYRVSFPGVKRPGRGVDHPPPSSAEVHERVELYLYLYRTVHCATVQVIVRLILNLVQPDDCLVKSRNM